MTQCKAVADDVIPRLVHTLRASMQNPDNQSSQLALLTAAQDMLQVCFIVNKRITGRQIFHWWKS